MIESYFGLTRRPFLAIPDVSAYYPSETMEEARIGIVRCLRRGEGVSLILGNSGVGKSLMLRLLARALDLDYAIASISNRRLKTPKSFLQQLLFELHQPYCGADENELRLLLRDHLRHSSVPGVVLLIDEAQTLSLSVLEEIRMMLHEDDGIAPKFRVALAGTFALEERLTHPKLRTFNQWIVSRAYLEPLSRKECAEYLRWQIHNARKTTSVPTEPEKAESGRVFVTESREESSDRFLRLDEAHESTDCYPVFDELAVKAVYELTEGVPRLINQLCDHALLELSERQHSRIVSLETVRSIWAKLQQVPESSLPDFAVKTVTHDTSVEPVCATFSPEEPKRVAPLEVIEFGTLEDEDRVETTNHVTEIPVEPNDSCEWNVCEWDNVETKVFIPTEAPCPESREEIVAEITGETVVSPSTTEEINVTTEAFAENEPEEDAAQFDDASTVVYTPQTQSQRIENSHSTPAAGHVYQAPTFYESAYPGGPNTPMANWEDSEHGQKTGTAVSYREKLYRNLRESREEIPSQEIPARVVLPLGMELPGNAKCCDPRKSLPGFVPKEPLEEETLLEETVAEEAVQCVTEMETEPEVAAAPPQTPLSPIPSTSVLRVTLNAHDRTRAHKTKLDDVFVEEIPLSGGTKRRCEKHVPGSSRVLVSVAISPDTLHDSDEIQNETIPIGSAMPVELKIYGQSNAEPPESEPEAQPILPFLGGARAENNGNTIDRTVRLDLSRTPVSDAEEAEPSTISFQEERRNQLRAQQQSQPFVNYRFVNKETENAADSDAIPPRKQRLKLQRPHEEENHPFTERPAETPEREEKCNERKRPAFGTVFSKIYRNENIG